jgi:hypothetical protein
MLKHHIRRSDKYFLNYPLGAVAAAAALAYYIVVLYILHKFLV